MIFMLSSRNELKHSIMNKKTFLLITVALLASVVYSQQFKGAIDSAMLPAISVAHYQPEYLIDQPVDAAAWTKVQRGMHAAFGSEDELYFRTEVPQIKDEASVWQATAWKGE